MSYSSSDSLNYYPPVAYPQPTQSTATMELQPWSRELQPAEPSSTYGRNKLTKHPPQLGYQPAQVSTKGTGQFQSTNGMVGVAAGNRDGKNFAGIITNGRDHKIQVKGDATVIIDRKNNIRAQVDEGNYAEYTPHGGGKGGGVSGNFKQLVKAFDALLCCRPQ